MKNLALLTLLFFSHNLFAGGPAWNASVKSVYIKKGSVTFELINKDKIFSPFQTCNPLKIIAKYEGEPWYLFSKSWSSEITSNDFDEATQFLKQAMVEGITINFGYIGSGIIPINKRGICTVKSKGLKLHNSSITSFYDPV